MKVAFCYSGHIGRVVAAAKTNKRMLLPAEHDVFICTSDAVSQKAYPKAPRPFYNVDKKLVRPYLPGGIGWRKHAKTYGIIYPFGNKMVFRELNKAFGSSIKAYKIDKEFTLKDDMTISRWQWTKDNQWLRVYGAQNLMEKYATENKIDYDIVVRSRLDCAITKRIDIASIFQKHKGHKRKIFVIGGWKNQRFMDSYLVDCFMFGNPEVMRILADIYKRTKPYPFDPKYKTYHSRYGDSSEYQVLRHLQENNIELVYFHKRAGLYKVLR